ncbi:MAG: superoxide dismutase [Sporolactobacillus sp.]
MTVFTLPELPYAADALEPYIDEQTMTIHHDRHHRTYVDNLNRALADYESLSSHTLEQLLRALDELPPAIRTAVRNNGGGHYNHSLYWTSLRSGRTDNAPEGPLSEQIGRTWGDFSTFKQAFSDTATARFGSGWAWLFLTGTGKLAITSLPNQDNPLMDGGIPLLGLDVWEHAYYLLYQNRRPDYIRQFFNIIDWDAVAERYAAASERISFSN